MSYIPEHAKKVFEGVIFDTYQWDQELFDGSITTFETVQRNSIAVIIPIVDGKILVIKEEQPGRPPYMAVPAGFTENYDATPLHGAQRELQEETGLTSDDWVLLDTYNVYPRMTVIDYVYVARNCTRTHEKMLGAGEKQHGEFLFSYEEFIDLYDHADFASFFLKPHLTRAKFDPEYKELLRQKIFGN